MKTIHLAGGCFWGVEHLFSQIPGVISATSGYANGFQDKQPTYQEVKTGKTGFFETVQVVYDEQRISLEKLLWAYFEVVDPTAVNQQGHDVGTQYQAAIFPSDPDSERVVDALCERKAREITGFSVLHSPLKNFYKAEEYHQHYLDKNPQGYCHIPLGKMKEVIKALS